jgi:fumarylacetoacetase
MRTDTALAVNATHDPARRSWLASANAEAQDFPIQNLPFGQFRSRASGFGAPTQGGVALGDEIIDLAALLQTGLLDGFAMEAAGAAAGPSLAPLLTCAPAAVSALRARLSDLFREGGPGDPAVLASVLIPMAQAELVMPLRPTAFTDFCTSIDHIRRMGRGNPPKLAAMTLPVAYNGRASSVMASGRPVVRPTGQFETPPGSANLAFGPEPMLDFELEFGAWLRGPGNRLGHALRPEEAEGLLFGCCLVNDWSARAIQYFEMILGPHLGKSFLTTVSPWIVTMEALAPFRCKARGRNEGEPEVPAYLLAGPDRSHGAISVTLTADLVTSGGASLRVTETELSDLYWTLAQMVTHQASGGAPLEAGDLIATGTVSGASERSRACLAEITTPGGQALRLPDGSERVMLEDGDTLTIRGRAHADGFRPIGFGDCSGTILPAGTRASS